MIDSLVHNEQGAEIKIITELTAPSLSLVPGIYENRMLDAYAADHREQGDKYDPSVDVFFEALVELVHSKRKGRAAHLVASLIMHPDNFIKGVGTEILDGLELSKFAAEFKTK